MLILYEVEQEYLKSKRLNFLQQKPYLIVNDYHATLKIKAKMSRSLL